ncbi:hypothetical protein [Domibacillus mangrovi]|uniref:Uncharacterized protein n=1 Tax=Domibacillus mangrovi TaxID=1714354 RepID=A0A1Q5P065_9BACI|nr:hypothetical protein [Domibacillus mangrovi]OKL35655.1 hypothetical protein BLL40_13790 [Domibacillus mangrovi]
MYEWIIIEGRITAAHTVIKRHPFRIPPFESDPPGWLGLQNLVSFRWMNDYKERRELIKEACHKCSITTELFYKLMCL